MSTTHIIVEQQSQLPARGKQLADAQGRAVVSMNNYLTVILMFPGPCCEAASQLSPPVPACCHLSRGSIVNYMCCSCSYAWPLSGDDAVVSGIPECCPVRLARGVFLAPDCRDVVYRSLRQNRLIDH